MVIIKSPQEIDKLRHANQIVAGVLKRLKSETKAGVTTLELNDLAEKMTRKAGAKPAFKGYRGFPFALCASVNDQVVHGFPNKKPLKNGDILSVDFGVLADGYYGDAAITIAVGSISEMAKRLMRVTEESLYLGIDKAVPGGRLSDISNAIQTHVETAGFAVVRKFVGHGIGSNLHEEPQIPNFGQSGMGIRLKAGMTLAIEPMVNEKDHDVKILDDGWTAVTVDKGLSAHFEHSIAITKNGPVILSSQDGG